MAWDAKRVWAVAAVVLLALSAGGYYAYVTYVPRTPPPVTFLRGGAASAPETFDLRGTFFLSLVPLKDRTRFDLYQYSLDEDQLSLVIASSTLQKQYYMNYSAGLSTSGKSVAFARKTKYYDPLQIYTYRLDDSRLRKITTTSDPYKRGPVWSPDDTLIAYVSHNTRTSATDPNPEHPENWTVYLTDFAFHRYVVGYGVNPLFSPDGKALLVLKNDGLHLIDIANPAKPVDKGLVLGTEGGRASQTMKIGLSNDKTLLAWPSVAANQTVVYRVSSWTPFEAAPLLTIRSKAYWSVFSPDNKYLAQEEVEAPNSPDAEIVVYQLSSGVSKKVLDLTGFNKTYSTFTAWRY